MRAAVFEHYGPPAVVTLKDVPQPQPAANEVLIKIHATTVSAGDWRIRSLSVPSGFGVLVRLAFGVFKPRKRILGMELSGEIIAIGNKVTKFSVGDRVIAFTGGRLGCHAEFIALPEDAAIAPKPPGLSDIEAAALMFGGTTALDFLRDKGKLQPGERVLINGASGAVGSAAVQLAKHFGAEVTGVCGTANVELVSSLGADHAIDYTTTDFLANGERYDIIFDAVGNADWARAANALTERGRLLMVVASLPAMLRVPFVSKANGKKAIAGTAAERAEDVRLLAELAATGAYKPMIDRVYPFDEIVDAHARVESRRKRGSVVVEIASDSA